MKIAIVAAEMGPLAKAGGLGDVIGALPQALLRAGAKPSVILPGYRDLLEHKASSVYEGNADLLLGGERESYRVLRADGPDGVPLYLIDHPNFFNRAGIYGESGTDYPDNIRRFIFFGRAAATVAAKLNPDVLHAHDWHASVATLVARADSELRERFAKTVSAFTIHNLAFQGLCTTRDFPLLGLDWSWYSVDALEFYGQVNLMKGAVMIADGVSTVSPSYAYETAHDPELGFGLDGVLRGRGEHYCGIINGADYHEWDPSKDQLIGTRYTPSRRAGKKACLYDLREEFKLPHLIDTPVIGMVTRMTSQKGIDLLVQALDRLLDLDVQLVMLASGDRELERQFQLAAQRHHDRLRVINGFDNGLAHRIQAGSDMFLMPSRYEPCGLTQMYALKYGTVPIVRATGGLKDTITDFDPVAGTGNGFTFTDYTPEALTEAVQCAVEVFRSPGHWVRLMSNCFKSEFSWAYSAEQYIKWFDQLIRETAGK
ncbi:MAG TPA: glycogen synthase GlgA [Candidatus Binataceae bacterium]|nr:glycogen synthase GlgA [Candidatus Binataceae bacterium]